eukprot:COSAG01_NODE_675_length_14330_cov_20.977022_4_plen_67_part_00
MYTSDQTVKNSRYLRAEEKADLKVRTVSQTVKSCTLHTLPVPVPVPSYGTGTGTAVPVVLLVDLSS